VYPSAPDRDRGRGSRTVLGHGTLARSGAVRQRGQRHAHHVLVAGGGRGRAGRVVHERRATVCGERGARGRERAGRDVRQLHGGLGGAECLREAGARGEDAQVRGVQLQAG
jgi:hypothetical protein